MSCSVGSSSTVSQPVVKKELIGIQEVYFFDEELPKNGSSSVGIGQDKDTLESGEQTRSMFPIIEPDTEIDMINEVIEAEDGAADVPAHTEIRDELNGSQEEMGNVAVPIEIKKFTTMVRGRKSQISYRVVDESHFNMIKDQENCKKKIITKDDPRTHTHYVKFLKKEGKTHKIWECGICSKEFRHQYTLMRHLPTHTDERNYKCETCGKGFRQMSTLSQHRAIHSDARPYVCELCKKTFNRVSTLISHRKTHSDDKPHKCEICGKGFHQKGNLRNHKFTHTNERPYKCESCGKGFNQMSNLMCHKLKAHSHGNKRYICTLCNLEFPRKHALKSHEEYKHGFKIRGQREQDLYTSLYPNLPHKHDLKNGLHENFIQNHKIIPNEFSHHDRDQNSTSVGVVIDPITTKAMTVTRQTGQIPFALLKLVKGNPVLVKVMMTSNGKHILLPATADDLRSANIITVFPNSDNSRNGSSLKALQIKVPIVATVIQKLTPDGNYTISVESPDSNHNFNAPPLESLQNGPSMEATSSGELKRSLHSSHFLYRNGSMLDGEEEYKTEADALLEKAVSMIQKEDPVESSSYQQDSATAGLMEFVSNDDDIQFVCTSPDGTYKVLSQEEAADMMQQPGQTIEVVSNEKSLMEENGRNSLINKSQLNQIVESMLSAGFQTADDQEIILNGGEEPSMLGEFGLSASSQAVFSRAEEILP
ncbi:uncharacterized protein [Anabrus simplex]|uniref:uncharacterized protein n=1 Tax=Anabrus simplex TaxID=316456 RepID=UPI0034DD91B5